MKKLLSFVLTTLVLAAQADPEVIAEPSDKLFKGGQLDAAQEGRAAVLTGQVLEIKLGPGNNKLYQIDPKQEYAEPVWVATLVPIAEGEIKPGDGVVFKGYVAKAETLDSSGKLEAMVDASTMLLARTAEASETSEKSAPSEKSATPPQEAAMSEAVERSEESR